jgi:hypothetical protein
MAQPEGAQSIYPAGKHRYKTVVDGCAMAARFRNSGLTVGEFVRQTGVSRRMVDYWTRRERELAHTMKDGFAEVTPAIEHVAVDVAPAAVAPVPERQPTPEPPKRALSPPPTIELRLPGGAAIVIGPGFDPAVLRAVVACLGSSPC